VGFFLGFSYLFGVVLDFGVVAVYAGIVLYYVWATAVAAYGFRVGGWADRAAEMMDERGTTPDD
jgi:MATE family multidrug resistance protein